MNMFFKNVIIFFSPSMMEPRVNMYFQIKVQTKEVE